jgi:hypothetical protein
MKRIDASKKYRVTLTFLLDEEVTPVLFARKVAAACSSGALRPGEGIVLSDGTAIIVTDKKTSLPL